MNLTGEQRQELKNVLLDALEANQINGLEQIVSLAFDKNVFTIVPTNADLDTAVYKVIVWADARSLDYVLRLLVAAGQINGENEKLKATRDIISQAVGQKPCFPTAYQAKPAPQLERILHKVADFADVVRWRNQMEMSEAAVCRIEISPGKPEGTGFLVAPDLVITNYHVLKDIWQHPNNSANVVCRFDYKKAEDGISVSAGRIYHLATDWEVVKGGEAANELDFVLMRLAGVPGNDVLQEQQGRTRGWLEPQDLPFAKGDPLCILQHPMGNPLALSFAEIIQIPAGENYVVHDVNTQPGSSGSPCFDARWRVVALHYYGTPDGNRALPFGPILNEIQTYLPPKQKSDQDAGDGDVPKIPGNEDGGGKHHWTIRHLPYEALFLTVVLLLLGSVKLVGDRWHLFRQTNAAPSSMQFPAAVVKPEDWVADVLQGNDFSKRDIAKKKLLQWIEFDRPHLCQLAKFWITNDDQLKLRQDTIANILDQKYDQNDERKYVKFKEALKLPYDENLFNMLIGSLCYMSTHGDNKARTLIDAGRRGLVGSTHIDKRAMHDFERAWEMLTSE